MIDSDVEVESVISSFVHSYRASQAKDGVEVVVKDDEETGFSDGLAATDSLH